MEKHRPFQENQPNILKRSTKEQSFAFFTLLKIGKAISYPISLKTILDESNSQMYKKKEGNGRANSDRGEFR